MHRGPILMDRRSHLHHRVLVLKNFIFKIICKEEKKMIIFATETATI